MKRSTALATAALMLASAATIAPAFADEADDLAPARVQRNWNGGGNIGGGQRTHARADTSNGYATQAPAPVVVTRPAATPVAHDDDEDNGRRAARSQRVWNGEQPRGDSSAVSQKPAGGWARNAPLASVSARTCGLP